MKRSSLFAVWGVLYLICAGLGFIPEPEGLVRILLMGIALLFFVPPAILLHDAFQRREHAAARRICILAMLSLTATVVLLIANIVSALSAPALGGMLHVLLVAVSAPMFCSNYWAVSLFLWAVLLLTARKGMRTF